MGPNQFPKFAAAIQPVWPGALELTDAVALVGFRIAKKLESVGSKGGGRFLGGKRTRPHHVPGGWQFLDRSD
jgi:hypothetical protein